MFGHVDAGCLHVRPALDMKDPAQEALVREISDEVFALTRKYKGVLWGEHGKGFRSEYVPEFFGPLYPRMQEIKAAFDPYNQLNPGKIASPPGHELTRLDAVGTRGQPIAAFPSRCARPTRIPCIATATPPASTTTRTTRCARRGRHARPKALAQGPRIAHARVAAAAGGTGHRPGAIGGTLGALGPARRWLEFPARAVNTWRARRGSADFSLQVKEAMDGCLACKSCVGQCPIKVDVPAFRSRFLEAYHGRYLRPAKDHLVAGLENWLPLAARFPRLVNAATHNRVGRGVAGALGLVALPELATIALQIDPQSRGRSARDVAGVARADSG
jgi:ferredoxin